MPMMSLVGFVSSLLFHMKLVSHMGQAKQYELVFIDRFSSQYQDPEPTILLHL